MKETAAAKKGPGEGFDVARVPKAARVAMIGFPSVGKSTLLSTLTKTESLAAAYEFTTLTCIPGILKYNDTTIQLLDLPGIIEGAADGKGRGRQVISVARGSDMVLMVLDASKAAIQRKLLTKELYDVGIRLNRRRPDIAIKMKKGGGVSLNSMCELTHMDVNMVRDILHLHKMHNCDVLFRKDYRVDDFIDCVAGNRRYLPALYCINKCDTITLNEVDYFAHMNHTAVISCQNKLNLEYLLQQMWEHLDLIRLYTKPRGSRPDFTDPIVTKRGSLIEDVCNYLHKDFAKRFKYALVWGRSVKHQPQRVGLKHVLMDEDVVALYTK
jgi:small GTP-binding protein